MRILVGDDDRRRARGADRNRCTAAGATNRMPTAEIAPSRRGGERALHVTTGRHPAMEPAVDEREGEPDDADQRQQSGDDRGVVVEDEEVRVFADDQDGATDSEGERHRDDGSTATTRPGIHGDTATRDGTADDTGGDDDEDECDVSASVISPSRLPFSVKAPVAEGTRSAAMRIATGPPDAGTDDADESPVRPPRAMSRRIWPGALGRRSFARVGIATRRRECCHGGGLGWTGRDADV